MTQPSSKDKMLIFNGINGATGEDRHGLEHRRYYTLARLPEGPRDGRRPLPAGFEWQAGLSSAESTDPRVRALFDLAHVLLNSNEFLYLH